MWLYLKLFLVAHPKCFFIVSVNLIERLINSGCRKLVSAYVLARVESGKGDAALTDIKGIPGVNKISKTFGAYDLAIEVDFCTIQELDEFVFGKLCGSIKTKKR